MHERGLVRPGCRRRGTHDAHAGAEDADAADEEEGFLIGAH
jgi:hypothetical protein